MERSYGDYSRKISERQWNLPDKGELESRREATFMDDIIQKAHIGVFCGILSAGISPLQVLSVPG